MRLIKPVRPVGGGSYLDESECCSCLPEDDADEYEPMMCRTPGSSGVALREQMVTSGVVVAAWYCCRLLMYVDLELLIAEEEADLLS
jgi:hypothetical protein